MKKLLVCVMLLILPLTLKAIDLNISGQNSRTYDGGTYDQLNISSSSNITVKNCNFSSGSGHVVNITSSSRNIMVENCDINGLINACTGVNIGGGSNGVTIKGCDIHDIADDGFQIVGADDIHLLGNTVRALYGCGTDGGCGPCYNGHSDGIELNDNNGVEIVGNLIFDVRSTSALIIGSWNDRLIENVTVYNNIFFTPECGFVAYITDARNVKVYNNTMWRGVNGGLALGPNNQNIVAKNNILTSLNFKHMGETYNPAVYDFGYNLLAFIGASQDYNKQDSEIWNLNPLFTNMGHALDKSLIRTVKAEDFSLQSASAAINAGTSDADVPATDFFGNPRVGAPDLGAVEFQGTGILPTEFVNRMAKPQLPAARFYTIRGQEVRNLCQGTGVYIVTRQEGGISRVEKAMVVR